MTMMLDQLLPDESGLPDIAVHGLANDSRKVQPGDLFLAAPGITVDGRKFIKAAEEKRAVAVLCDPPVPDEEIGIPVLEINSVRQLTGAIASRFYGDPSEKLLVVAITGTNGKTSCSHFIAHALSSLNSRCGVIGTIGVGVPDDLQQTSMTTPDALDLQRYLAAFVEDGCSAVTIEASSHGLEQGRLNGTQVDTAIFTNITRDHLDYHPTFNDYLGAKKSLFRFEGLKVAIINIDDESSESLLHSISEKVDIYTVSISDPGASISASDIKPSESGFDFQLSTPWGDAPIQSGLIGLFNVTNLLTVTAVLGAQGFSIEQISTALSQVQTVKGRMETLGKPGGPVAIIDYAHTPDALEKALIAARAHCRGKLWCVMGCGGDRDIGKRPIMGGIASRLSDYLVITDDNPRSESSEKIADDIYQGVKSCLDSQATATIEIDRKTAIIGALGAAQPGDIVVIAGKGHEAYQEINGERLTYSDHAVVGEFFGNDI